jgi:hypothetical protein
VRNVSSAWASICRDYSRYSLSPRIGLPLRTRARAEAVGEAWDRDEPNRVGELHVELPGFAMQSVARGRFGCVHLRPLFLSAAWPAGEGG